MGSEELALPEELPICQETLIKTSPADSMSLPAAAPNMFVNWERISENIWVWKGASRLKKGCDMHIPCSQHGGMYAAASDCKLFCHSDLGSSTAIMSAKVLEAEVRLCPNCLTNKKQPGTPKLNHHKIKLESCDEETAEKGSTSHSRLGLFD